MAPMAVDTAIGGERASTEMVASEVCSEKRGKGASRYPHRSIPSRISLRNECDNDGFTYFGLMSVKAPHIGYNGLSEFAWAIQTVYPSSFVLPNTTDTCWN